MNEKQRLLQSKIKQEDLLAPNDPMAQLMMLLANSTKDKLSSESENPRVRHKLSCGFHLLIERESDWLGVWSSWLGNNVALHYPRCENPIPSELVKNHLNVDVAKPVKYTQVTAVHEGYNEQDYKDPDKPLEVNSVGQMLAYKDDGYWPWSLDVHYVGERQPEGGRLWITDSKHDPYARHYRLDDDRYYHYPRLVGGHEHTRTLTNVTYPLFNRYALDLPTTKQEVISKFQSNLFPLLVEWLAGSEVERLTLICNDAWLPSQVEIEFPGFKKDGDYIIGRNDREIITVKNNFMGLVSYITKREVELYRQVTLADFDDILTI